MKPTEIALEFRFRFYKYLLKRVIGSFLKSWPKILTKSIFWFTILQRCGHCISNFWLAPSCRVQKAMGSNNMFKLFATSDCGSASEERSVIELVVREYFIPNMERHKPTSEIKCPYQPYPDSGN